MLQRTLQIKQGLLLIPLFLWILSTFCSPVMAATQRLLPVPRDGGGVGARDLGKWSSGTLLYQASRDVPWQPVGEADNSVETRKLLSPDPSASVELPDGKQDFLLEFDQLERVDRLALRQLSAGTVVRAYAGDAPYSSDSSSWRSLGGPTEASEGVPVKLSFPVNSTQFIRLSLELPDSGSVSPVFLPGIDLIEEESGRVPAPEEWPDASDRREFDFARSAAGGRVAYVGSGEAEEAPRIVDGDPTTFFKFESAGQNGLFIVELAETYPVYQASIVTAEPISSVKIWSFPAHPDAFRDETGGLSVPQAYFSQRPPTGQVEVPEDEDRDFVKIPLPETSARYLLVRVASRNLDRPTEISLFSVLGRVPREVLPYGRARAAASPDRTPRPTPPQTDPPRIPVASP